MIHGIRWQSGVDFAVLSVAFYILLLWAKQTRALHFALMIVGFHATALWAGHFGLTLTSWVFEGASLAVIGLLVLMFQAELQHSLLRLDSICSLRFHPPAASSRTYDAIVAALFDVAHRHIGALIVLTRKDPLGGLVTKGVRIDSDVSEGLLEAIFRKESPIHDGAVIIEGDRIAYARVVLPMSARDDVPAEFGTRHRAALGLAESSDALVMVASEDRGQVTMIDGHAIVPLPDAASLRLALYGLQPKPEALFMAKVHIFLFANVRYRISALALASLIWGVSYFGGAATIKNVVVPIEFADVPSDLYIANPAVNSVNFELRGNSWLMNPVIASLAAHVEVAGLKEGWHIVHLNSNSLQLPPGVTVERLSPENIRVRLARRTTMPED